MKFSYNAFVSNIVLLVITLQYPLTTGTIVDLVNAIVEWNHASMIRGGELCVFTTPNSTLNDHAPDLIPMLLSKYPMTFISTLPFIDTKRLREATIVLLDTSGYPDEVS